MPAPAEVALEQYFSTPDDRRYEVKFVTSMEHLPVVLAWLETHPAGFAPTFPPRRVRNVYFDTPELAAWSSNVAGISRRLKPRLRWYGDGNAPAQSRLEVKHRKASEGWKTSVPIDVPLDLEAMRWSEVLRVLRDASPPAVRLLLEVAHSATLINQYDRRYLETPDRRLRVTIDEDVRVWPQIGRSRPQLRHPSRLPDAIVVELKCDTRDRKDAERALAEIPLRASRMSKYVSGIDSLLL